MKNLKLSRPIVFVDLETTGLNPSADRIVEISLLKIHVNGDEEYFTRLINPRIPIPPEATAIHGINNADVAGKPDFTQCAGEINAFLAGCDLSGFNIKKFDLPLLETELKRANINFSRRDRAIIDTQFIYHQFERRDLEAAYFKYCGKKLDNKHHSTTDVRAAMEILDGQVALYGDLPKDINGLHQFCCTPEEINWADKSGKFVLVDNAMTFNFGKYKGRTLIEIIEIDRDYVLWIAHNANFTLEVQELVLNALND